MPRSTMYNATLTEANLSYAGSITIDEGLLERVGLWPGEKVLVVSNTSGTRLETHVTRKMNKSGDVHLKGRTEMLPVSRTYLHLFRQM